MLYNFLDVKVLRSLLTEVADSAMREMCTLPVYESILPYFLVFLPKE